MDQTVCLYVETGERSVISTSAKEKDVNSVQIKSLSKAFVQRWIGAIYKGERTRQSLSETEFRRFIEGLGMEAAA